MVRATRHDKGAVFVGHSPGRARLLAALATALTAAALVLSFRGT
jgi:hypothetical protein